MRLQQNAWLVFLGMMLVILVYNTRQKELPLSYAQPESNDVVTAAFGEEPAWVQREIELYVNASLAGLSHIDITHDVFKMSKILSLASPEHPQSFPFVSGDTFRAFADFEYVAKEQKAFIVFSRNKWFKTGPDRPHKDGDIIFVKTDYINAFAEQVLPELDISFVLITHNSGYPAPKSPNASSVAILDDPKLIRWFAANPSMYHPKLEALPLGLEDRRYNLSGRMEDFVKVLSSGIPPTYSASNTGENWSQTRPLLAYVNFNEHHHPDRLKAFEIFKEIGHVVREKSRNQIDYLTDLTRTKFVVSPRGTGEDCHRHWESILMGAIPIVTDSRLRDLFYQAPTKVISQWDIGEGLSESDLLEFSPPTTSRELVMARYWMRRIESVRPEERRREF